MFSWRSKVLLLITCSVVLNGCSWLRNNQGNQQVPLPIPTEVVEAPPVSGEGCGIESCHGLNITCGANVPEVCTEEYRLGDFCRQFAKCAISNDTCVQVPNSTFERCKSCVEQCDSPADPTGAFECESKCREQFE